jgi:predicted nuclease with TOPRIM domain
VSVRTTQIVAVIATVLGLAGVAVGAYAVSESKSDEDISDAVRSELSEQLGESEKRTGATEAELQRRLKVVEDELATLTGKQKALTQEFEALSDRVNKLSSDLSADVNRIDSRLTELSTRIDNLSKSNSGP